MGAITLSEEVKDNLSAQIREKNWPKVNEISVEIHPYDLWEFIEELSEDTQQEILSNFRRRILVELMPELPDERQIEFVEIISPKRAAELLTTMPSDDGVDVLINLPLDVRRKILRYFKKEEREDIRRLLKHPADSAGGIMATEAVYLPEEVSVKEAIDYLRETAREFETIYYVYVSDKEQKLVGVLSLRDLVRAPGDDMLKDIMNPDVIKVNAEMDQEAVARITADYDLAVVPVVDDNNILLGIVTIDDVLDVIEEEVVEDMGHLAGTGEKIDKLIDAPLLTVVKARLPWLIFALIGEGLISSYVLKLFETTLAAFIMLALFIPVIMALGGNVGVQSSTIFIRGLATKDIEKPGRYLLRELKIGFIMGILIGVGVTIVAQLVVKMPIIGIIVGTSMFFTMTLASVTGILIPGLFSRIGIDPAISSSPLISTTQDILSLTIYFSLAKSMLNFLS
ncbi:MAG: magnesium transporter [Candidatus Hydrothermarchaeaceae archaeon]